jgi:dynein light intermediate chain
VDVINLQEELDKRLQ